MTLEGDPNAAPHSANPESFTMKLPRPILVSLASVLLIIVAIGILHFINIKPDQISWLRWVEHAFNRYQTFLAGFGAIIVAWLSVEKISEQITLQRQQAVSDKRFAMRRELSALTECIRLSGLIDNTTEEETIELGKYANSNHPYIEANPDQILEFHRAYLPMDVCMLLERLGKLVHSHNNFHEASPVQQAIFGTPQFAFLGIKANGKALEEKVLAIADELDTYLK